MNQSLSDLGYKKKERNKLTPVVAHDIIKNQTQFVEDVEIEGDETKKTLSDWDLLYLRLNDAIDRLIDSPNGDEILNLTSLEKNPDKIDAYLKKIKLLYLQ